MYKIERRTVGYLLTFSGMIDQDEMTHWYEESSAVLTREKTASFGVISDMRTLVPLPAIAQSIMVKGQKLFKSKGMKRSAVILTNAMTTVQFKRLAKDSGIYQSERYIDASGTVNWAETAVAWVKDGTDPGK